MKSSKGRKNVRRRRLKRVRKILNLRLPERDARNPSRIHRASDLRIAVKLNLRVKNQARNQVRNLVRDVESLSKLRQVSGLRVRVRVKLQARNLLPDRVNRNRLVERGGADKTESPESEI
jgi:hypothetical protein